MGSSENFCLQWNDFQENISSTFQEHRTESDFYDVILACKNSNTNNIDQVTRQASHRTVKAHKFILSSCSTFFKDVLKSMTVSSSCGNTQPLIYLSGIDFQDLESVLDFMYFGKVNISQERLTSFLAAAEELKVKGLVQSKAEVAATKRPVPSNKSAQHSAAKKSKFTGRRPNDENGILNEDFGGESSSSFQEFLGDDDVLLDAADEGEYADAFKDDLQGHSEESGGVESKDWRQLPIEEALDGVWRCLACGQQSAYRRSIIRHYESKHMESKPISCEICFRVFATKNSYSSHVSRAHKGAHVPIIDPILLPDPMLDSDSEKLD